MDVEELSKAPPAPSICFFFLILYLMVTYLFYSSLLPPTTFLTICQHFPPLLDRYLSTDPEHVTDTISWWYEKRFVYPCLHHMALDYLTIPGRLFNFLLTNN